MTILEQIAPRLAKAHEERRLEVLKTRPCGRVGWCCACWLKAEKRSGRVVWTRYESAPWFYDPNDPRYAPDWPYTLVQYDSGFRTRIYDWELEHS